MSTKLRTFLVGNKEVQFHAARFKAYFYKMAKDKKIKLGTLEEQLANSIFSTQSTVHTWRHGASGPSDIEKVKGIADFFQVNYLDLLIEVSNSEKGDNEMQTTLTEKIENATIRKNGNPCSYFTKASILKAYDMITEFIYADDPEDIFGFISLAVKIRNMEGCIPPALHSKLMEFVMTEVKSWMLYDIPDLDDFEDEEVELANAVYETPFTILRNLHSFAEAELEPFINSTNG